MLEQDFVPPPGVRVEFHWYAAEEGGLLGSQDIAAAHEKAGAKVRGMLQMDSVYLLSRSTIWPLMTTANVVTAFVKNGTTPIIGLFGDQVDGNLTSFTTKLVDTYLPISWNITGCGKTCGSDHMSWHKAGYRAAFATESLFEGELF